MEFIKPQEPVPLKKTSRKKTIAVFGVSTVLFLVFGVFVLTSTKQDQDKTASVISEPTTTAPEAEPDYTSVTGRYLFNGTIVLARAVEKYARGDYAQPFSKLSTLEPQKYDAWAADFECPITSNVVPYETQIARLVFNCRPEWLPELTKYVQLFNLANNHTGDQGYPEGFEETRKNLQAAGVQYFGNYDP